MATAAAVRHRQATKSKLKKRKVKNVANPSNPAMAAHDDEVSNGTGSWITVGESTALQISADDSWITLNSAEALLQSPNHNKAHVTHSQIRATGGRYQPSTDHDSSGIDLSKPHDAPTYSITNTDYNVAEIESSIQDSYSINSPNVRDMFLTTEKSSSHGKLIAQSMDIATLVGDYTDTSEVVGSMVEYTVPLSKNLPTRVTKSEPSTGWSFASSRSIESLSLTQFSLSTTKIASTFPSPFDKNGRNSSFVSDLDTVQGVSKTSSGVHLSVPPFPVRQKANEDRLKGGKRHAMAKPVSH